MKIADMSSSSKCGVISDSNINFVFDCWITLKLEKYTQDRTYQINLKTQLCIKVMDMADFI